MTFAPESILAVRRYLKGQDADLSDPELGIVGGPSHVRIGTSYHLGRDQLLMSKNPYSARTARDKAGLSSAASALDVDDDLDELRELSVWVVAECRRGAPDTLDLREVICSPDGVRVLQWDRERGVTSVPVPHSDMSHLTHTHFSWYRDSEFRPKVGLFQRFYAERRQRKGVPTVFMLKHKQSDAVYISDGVQTRYVPGGQWDKTCEPLIAAGVPFLRHYADEAEVFAAGGPPSWIKDTPAPTPVALTAEDRAAIVADLRAGLLADLRAEVRDAVADLGERGAAGVRAE